MSLHYSVVKNFSLFDNKLNIAESQWTPGSKSEITRKIGSKGIPVVTLLKKGRLIDIRTLHVENVKRFGFSSLAKKD